MGYREEGDQVILTMSRDDYDRLIFIFGQGAKRYGLKEATALLDRLNEGNPEYTPYQVPK